MLSDMDKALLKRLTTLERLEPTSTHIPMTLLGRLQGFLPDWDPEVLADCWSNLVAEGLANAVPHDVVSDYGALTKAEEFLTEKGLRCHDFKRRTTEHRCGSNQCVWQDKFS